MTQFKISRANLILVTFATMSLILFPTYLRKSKTLIIVRANRSQSDAEKSSLHYVNMTKCGIWYHGLV
ncbi:CLUMA_CG015687, isoform A [Clunio marinus]|uniref:CLUMA_CG015687, isoform A n=1 Tax=Clunio marinus TaxID=568069 RepID=A0A1J1IS72_9DIPT|nr:CLUMA_CG015687, isoform A [Clunio marinus]